MGIRKRSMEGMGWLMLLDLSFYRGKHVFVTGHTGFKGSWLCNILVHSGAVVTGYSLPAPTTPNLFAISGIEAGMRSVIGDIRDIKQLSAALKEARPEIVFHLAAQPIVRESFRDPVTTFETNIMGTVNLLECIRQNQNIRSIVNITTDKVYLNDERSVGYREDDPLDGFDPYSNSKSCSELVTHSYYHSFFHDSGTAVSTVRAGNVIGGGDFAKDRILPDCVRAVSGGKPVLIRNPSSVRPYQHVLDALMAYLMIAQCQYENSRYSGWYNVGPEEADCVSTAELVSLFCEQWGPDAKWECRPQHNTPHEASYLRLDCEKIKSVFGWRPVWNIRKAVELVCTWTRAWMDGKNIASEMDRETADYLSLASRL